MKFPKEVTEKYESFLKENHDLFHVIFDMIEKRFSGTNKDYYIFSFLLCEFILEKLADEVALNSEDVNSFVSAINVLVESMAHIKYRAITSAKMMETKN